MSEDGDGTVKPWSRTVRRAVASYSRSMGIRVAESVMDLPTFGNQKCVSRSGVGRYRHAYDSDGVCVFCDQRKGGVWKGKVTLGAR